jgi:hypothetical protein
MNFLPAIFVLIAALSASSAATEHMFYSLSKRASAQTEQQAQPPGAHHKTRHHLKWITEQTKFPVHLTASKLALGDGEDSLKWSWRRMSDGKTQLELLDAATHAYVLSENVEQSSLHIAKYNNQTHEQLASYEPVLMRNGERVTDNATLAKYANERDIYSLVYLVDHKVSVERALNKHKIGCVADFLVSVAERDLIEPIMKQMEKRASFKLAVQANGRVYNEKSRTQAKGQALDHHQTNQLPMFEQNPSEPEMMINYAAHIPEQQVQQIKQSGQQFSPLPTLIQDQVMYPHPVDQPSAQQIQQIQQFQQMHKQAQQPQVYHQQIYPAPQPPVHQQQQHQKPFNPFGYVVNSIQHQPHADAHYQAVQRHQQQVLDLLVAQSHAYMYQPHASFLASPPLMLYHMKRKRDAVETDLHELTETGKQQPNDSDITEDDPEANYDKRRFVKIRLTLGPVTLFRPLLKSEQASCSLDLIDVDGAELDYHATVWANVTAHALRSQDEVRPKKMGILNVDIDKRPPPQEIATRPPSVDELRERIVAPITNDLNEIKNFLKSQELQQKLTQQAQQRQQEAGRMMLQKITGGHAASIEMEALKADSKPYGDLFGENQQTKMSVSAAASRPPVNVCLLAASVFLYKFLF